LCNTGKQPKRIKKLGQEAKLNILRKNTILHSVSSKETQQFTREHCIRHPMSGCKIKRVNVVKAGCSLVLIKKKIIMVSSDKFRQLDYCFLNYLQLVR
jgi:hypothetical protein